ncbi:MAG: hypothetical protein AAFU85_32180 [Planctomycetota bacterium]
MESEEEQIHAGYKFESGMFARARSWTDLAPWIALIRVMRLLASPFAVALVTAGWILCRGVFFSLIEIEAWQFPADPIGVFGLVVYEVQTLTPLPMAVFAFVVFIVWLPIAAVMARQGAALTAGRDLPPLGQTFRILAERWWRCYLIPLVPVACVLTFCILLFLLRLPSLLLGIEAVSAVTGWLLGVLVIPAGILGFGALVAIPIAIAAVVNEPDADPIDSLSRGYEYLFRRPLNVFWYVLICLAMGYVVRLVFAGAASASGMMAAGLASVWRPDETLADAALFAISSIWVGFQITLQLGLLGGVYLLLRRDAGGQHVEDLWHPEPEPVESLPELPEKAYE